ncbi:hypothetical protein AA100600_2394 [Gluconobacter thailandicus F149-1 = NBRC 100600]|nr:hypothetical protein AA100600_2394 [Gluconobacter thailandicus F149-1 = NBRC 100600]
MPFDRFTALKGLNHGFGTFHCPVRHDDLTSAIKQSRSNSTSRPTRAKDQRPA